MIVDGGDRAARAVRRADDGGAGHGPVATITVVVDGAGGVRSPARRRCGGIGGLIVERRPGRGDGACHAGRIDSRRVDLRRRGRSGIRERCRVGLRADPQRPGRRGTERRKERVADRERCRCAANGRAAVQHPSDQRLGSTAGSTSGNRSVGPEQHAANRASFSDAASWAFDHRLEAFAAAVAAVQPVVFAHTEQCGVDEAR